MTDPTSLESRWAALGVWFVAPPSPAEQDVEQLLIDTARHIGENARLFQAVATWLATYPELVAKHRLRGHIVSQLAGQDSAAMGLLLDQAIKLGASKELAIPREVCRPVSPPRPLFNFDAERPVFSDIARKTASPLAIHWGLWASDVPLKPQIIRPISWILANNPSLRDRIIRRGDLRCSIVETLRRDTRGSVRSEAELARLTAASRAAVRKALNALEREGEVQVKFWPGNKRDKGVILTKAA